MVRLTRYVNCFVLSRKFTVVYNQFSNITTRTDIPGSGVGTATKAKISFHSAIFSSNSNCRPLASTPVSLIATSREINKDNIYDLVAVV